MPCKPKMGLGRPGGSRKTSESQPVAESAGVLSLFDFIEARNQPPAPKPNVKTRRIPDMTLADRQRFHRMYERKGPDECWPWKRGASGFGYGRFKMGGKLYSSHRIAYTLGHGPIPTGSLLVMHSCDNPACCNPRHLSLGTYQENAQDMAAKGRAGPGMPRKWTPTPEQLAEILASEESGAALAKKMGLHRRWVNRVRREHGIDNHKFRAARWG